MIKTVDLMKLEHVTNEAFMPLYKNESRFLLLKGGAGSSKSYFAAQKLIYRCLSEQSPGFVHRFLVCRKVANTLRKSCFALLSGRINAMGFSKLFKCYKSTMEIVCENGNMLMFAGLDDVEKLKSIYDPTSIWVEEASELEQSDVLQLNLRLRGEFPFYQQIMLTFNPISYGNFLRPTFFTDPPRADTTVHNSTYLDNRFIDAAYKEQLESYKELAPYYYQVYVLNEWGSSEGACFPEFKSGPGTNADGSINRAWTHVIRPFDPPKDWPIYRSFDFGYAKPFSVGWWAQDYDGRLYRILELYGCTGEPNVGIKWHPEEIAARIKETEDNHPLLKGRKINGVADPSIWDASRGDSVADVMMRHRVYFDPADNKRIPGKMQVHYRLTFDENGIPMMYFFETCKAIIRTLPELTYSERDPEDVDTALEDHAYDDVRYLCQRNPIAPRKAVIRQAKPYNPLDGAGPEAYDRYDFYNIRV